MDLLLSRFEARRRDAQAFALANRVLLLKTQGGVDVDVALAAFPFEIDLKEDPDLLRPFEDTLRKARAT